MVGLAVSGMTTAVDSTNARMGDLHERVSRIEDRLTQLGEKMVVIEVKITEGFRNTQNAIQKKASLELPEDSDNADVRRIAATHITDTMKRAAELLAQSSKDGVTVFIPSETAIANAQEEENWSTSNFRVADVASMAELLKKYAILGNPSEIEKRLTDGTLQLNATDIVAEKTGAKVVLSDGSGQTAEVVGQYRPAENLSIYEVDRVLRVQ